MVKLPEDCLNIAMSNLLRTPKPNKSALLLDLMERFDGRIFDGPKNTSVYELSCTCDEGSCAVRGIVRTIGGREVTTILSAFNDNVETCKQGF